MIIFFIKFFCDTNMWLKGDSVRKNKMPVALWGQGVDFT